MREQVFISLSLFENRLVFDVTFEGSDGPAGWLHCSPQKGVILSGGKWPDKTGPDKMMDYDFQFRSDIRTNELNCLNT